MISRSTATIAEKHCRTTGQSHAELPGRRRQLALAISSLCTGLLLMLANPASAVAASDRAAAEQKINFTIPAGSLADALLQFSETSGQGVLFNADLVRGLKSKGLQGQFTAQQALQRLLEGSGLVPKETDSGSVTLEKAPVPAPRAADSITLAAVTVKGQQQYDPNDPYNEDYAVPHASTATKTDTPIMDTPVSVEVVPHEALKDQQAYRLQDAVKNVSGVQQVFTGGYNDFIIRGFDVKRLSFRNGARLPLVNIDTANAQQIEVLKGPASILYGRIEPGGMINVVTKRPQEESYYSLEQRFGSYDFYRTEANATGAVTKDKSLLYRVDFSYLNTGSFQDNIFDRRSFVAPALSWKPTDKLEFNLSYEYLDEDRPFNSGQPAIGHSIGQLPKNRTFNQPGFFDNTKNNFVDFNWTYKFNDQWQVRNGVNAMFLDETYNETYNGALLANQNLVRRTWFGGRKTHQQNVFLDLNGKFDTFGVKHNVLVGGDYFNQDQAEAATDVNLGTVNIFNPVFPTRDFAAIKQLPTDNNTVINNSWYGVYFQDQFTFWDKLHILGGGRYDMTSSSLGFSADSLAAAGATANGVNVNRFNPRVGILYQPQHWLSLYGNYVESIGSPNTGRSLTGTPFSPEIAKQFELGFKTELLDKRLTSTVAFFHLLKDNVLTTDPINPKFSVAVGEVRSQGIEVDVAGKVTDDLSLIGTYAWTDTRIIQDNSGNQGHRLPYAPLHAGSLWLKYEPQMEYLRGFIFGAGVYAADQRFGDIQNSYSDGAYARLDMMAAYKVNIGPTRLTTQLNINNVTDSTYYILSNRRVNLPAEPLVAMGSVRLEY